MKIALVVNGRSHEGGLTTYINTIIVSLRKLGYTVDIITPFGVSDVRKIRNTVTKTTDRILMGNPIMTIMAYITSQLLIGFYLFTHHLKKRYNVFYCVDASSTNVAAFIGKKLKVPLVERVGGCMTIDLITQGKIKRSSALQRYFENEEIKAYTSAEIVIPISTWVSGYVKSKCSEANTVSPIINGVDHEKFYYDSEAGKKAREQLGISDDRYILLFPSRLERRKGTVVALRALVELLEQDKDYLLIYPANGPDYDIILKLIQGYQIENYVIMLGGVDSDKMRMLYNMADVALIPSVTTQGWEEPLANCPLESMACGTPVVASDMGGLKDSVIHKKTGLLVKNGNSASLAHAIHYLKLNLTIANKLSVAGLNMISTKCASIEIAKQLNDHFEKVINHR